MNYTTISETTNGSELPGILNGETARVVEGVIRSGPGTSAATGTTGGLGGWQFSLNDDATLVFPIPPRVDVTVAPSLRLCVFPTNSEVSREAQFQLDLDVVHASATPVAGAGALTYNTADIAFENTAGTMQVEDTTLSTAIWDSVTAGYICGTLTRVAIDDGTELSFDATVLGASLAYTIER